MATLNMIAYFLQLLISVAVGNFSIRAISAATYWGDTEVLKQLKNSVDASSITPGSCLSSWDFTADPCDSLFSDRFTCGFRCDFTDSNGASRLTELTLDQAGYSSSSLSAVSWTLPFLQTLDLSGNIFSGGVPTTSLSNLTQLTRLSLSSNLFTGPIPDSIASLSNLQELYLDNNALHGPIPDSFNTQSNLNRIELQSNNLSGAFPQLASLYRLRYLDLSDNYFSGEIPSSLPPSLVEIFVRNNNLEGKIPSSIQFLSSLQVLDLRRNRLSGSAPSALFAHQSLQQLTLSYNSFTSVEVPETLGMSSELIAVDLSNNGIRGFLPMFMGLMPRLSALSLENNMFTGLIPTQYALKAVVTESGVLPFGRLLLGGNYLLGPIPALLMRLKPDTVNVSLVNNCLNRCPESFFFCQGGGQKSVTECKRFGPIIP